MICRAKVLTSSSVMRPFGSRARDLADVDANLARDAAHRRRGRRRRRRWHGRRRGGRSGRRRRRLASANIHDRRALARIVFAPASAGFGSALSTGFASRQRLALPLRPLPVSASPPTPRLVCSCGASPLSVRLSLPPFLSRRRLRLLAAAFVNGQDHLAGLDLVADLDLDLLDHAFDARRHFERRFVGLELEDRLVLLDAIAWLDQDLQHIALRNVLTEIGKDEFCQC